MPAMVEPLLPAPTMTMSFMEALLREQSFKLRREACRIAIPDPTNCAIRLAGMHSGNRQNADRRRRPRPSRAPPGERPSVHGGTRAADGPVPHHGDEPAGPAGGCEDCSRLHRE